MWCPNISSCMRLARPVREDRVARVEDRLVQERHHREDGQLHIVGRIARHVPRLVGGGLERLADLVPEGFRVGDRLAVGAVPHHRGQHLLEDERQVVGPPRRGGCCLWA